MGGLQETVDLLPLHPDPGEGGTEEAPGLQEDGGRLHRRGGPTADLGSTTPGDT